MPVIICKGSEDRSCGEIATRLGYLAVEPIDYSIRFHEALAKAFASHTPSVRIAYFDQAECYRSKLRGASVHLAFQPSEQVLEHCLTMQRLAA